MDSSKIQKLVFIDKKHGDKKRWRKTQYKRFLDTIAYELNLSHDDRKQVEYIIEKVGLKNLNRRASVEQIILSLAVFVKEKHLQRRIKWKEYRIFKEFDLTEQDHRTVLTNLLRFYMNLIPLNGLVVSDSLP